jgi:type VI secretion system protein
MGYDRTLLERLADPDPDARRTIRENKQRLMDSVMRHLQRMLNTRQGHVPIQPEYGMPDITDCVEGAPEALDRIRRAIKNSIEMFEPRLRRVKITHLPVGDDLNLHFGITGQLLAEKEPVPVHFSTTVSPSGNATISVGRDLDDYAISDSRGSLRRNDRSAASPSQHRRST